MTTRPVSRRSPDYVKTTRLDNPITGRREHSQPLMQDYWHTAERYTQLNTNTHIVTYTINFTPTESRRLQSTTSPASGAYAWMTRALNDKTKDSKPIYMDLLLVIEENREKLTGETLLHAHGYMTTYKHTQAHHIDAMLRDAAITGNKIQRKRGVHCRCDYNGQSIDIGWSNYISKDLNKRLKSCVNPDAKRFAATQSLKTAAKNHREQIIREYDERKELEHTITLRAPDSTTLIDQHSANDDRHSAVGESIRKTA